MRFKHQRRSPVFSKCQARLSVSTNEGHVPPSSSPSSRLRCLINAASARCLSSPAAAPASAAYCAVSGSTPVSVAALSLAISAVALSAAESAAAILLSAPPSPLTAGCPSASPSLSCFGSSSSPSLSSSDSESDASGLGGESLAPAPSLVRGNGAPVISPAFLSCRSSSRTFCTCAKILRAWPGRKPASSRSCSFLILLLTKSSTPSTPRR
mmetsp:Transcript_40736/g.93709  ORF Transcript_40736/g.93709 Transcript_40736/m.93709 type:complete len:211 (-) Transcript_40736:2357-2989(-)